MADAPEVRDASAPLAGTKWSLALLRYAQRRGIPVDTKTPGLRGRILEVRADDVVLELTAAKPGLSEHVYGKGYIQLSALTDPPKLFAAGTRVKTPFGRGVVLESRATEERLDYVVELVECKLAGGSKAIGYFAPSFVSYRPTDDRSFDELIADAVTLRNAGNELFKQGDYSSAVTQYERCQEVLAGVQNLRRDLSAAEKTALLDCFIKAVANSAQCCLQIATPSSLIKCEHLCAQAMEMDENNKTGQGEKILFRLGCAQLAQKKYEEAIATLQRPLLADAANAKAKLREAKEAVKKAAAAKKALWTAAFAKNSASAATAEQQQEDGSVKGKGKGAGATAEPRSPGAGASSPAPAAGASGPKVASSAKQQEGKAAPAVVGAGAGKKSEATKKSVQIVEPQPQEAVVEEQQLKEKEAEGQSSALWWALGGGVVLAGAALAVYALNKRR